MNKLLADQGKPYFGIVAEQPLPQSAYAAQELRFYPGTQASDRSRKEQDHAD